MDSDPDAGLRAHDHYARRLPPWRFRFRQMLLPLLRSETPQLARLQQVLRTPTLDSYFASTANLGTHTFFMIFLPILFWCGQTTAGRALVHMLALGVFWSGWVKDLLCLPRPLSPPVTRITMSGSAALEYGFISTHSTNAVSVAVYLIYEIQSGSIPVAEPLRSAAIASCCFYALSIVFGRLYCGMHGFSDVIAGSIMGASIAGLQLYFGPGYDALIAEGDWRPPVLSTLAILLAVRFHPEPADNCPCFDDSVAFAGVMIGAEMAQWHFSKSPYATSQPVPATMPFKISELGPIKTCLRLVVGIIIVFVWRALAKPLLLKLLPPLFRQIEYGGLSLPRRFFERASQYTKVPPLRDDNVIPPVRDILRKPRKRTVSVGPQSEADVRELLAQQEIMRRRSNNDLRSNGDVAISTSVPGTPMEVVHEDKKRLGYDACESDNRPMLGHSESENERKVFEAIERPRIRYDVEVVTKLVVYGGIAWLSCEWNAVLFAHLGLGLQ